MFPPTRMKSLPLPVMLALAPSINPPLPTFTFTGVAGAVLLIFNVPNIVRESAFTVACPAVASRIVQIFPLSIIAFFVDVGGVAFAVPPERYAHTAPPSQFPIGATKYRLLLSGLFVVEDPITK